MDHPGHTDTSGHILVVDDHHEIRDLLGRYLQQHGYRTSLADGGRTMRSILKEGGIDLIVLDLMMPEEDGLSLCRHVREQDGPPIIMLTAMGEETDRIVGLEMGADDYVTKPFSPRELLARIKAVLRWAQRMAAEPQPETDSNRLLFDRWVLDVHQRQLENREGVVLPLSTAEHRLLTTFIHHPRRVLSRDQLLDLTKGREAMPFDRSIDNQVSRLRKKIEEDPRNPTLIKTVWGGGYMFTPEVTEQ
ncbi:response regulator [Kistimonas scapharcae]|uniref:Response regulator n=1 Tax=Kistimonas scapharcae TaxID=1036133 RepID=A0ABP8V5Y7_9GAMM